MNNKYYEQIKEILNDNEELQSKYKELTEIIYLICDAIDLQEKSSMINKKINEMNQD